MSSPQQEAGQVSHSMHPGRFYFSGSSQASSSHVLALDGLRGIAILMVLIFHATREFGQGTIASALGSFGWCGVDLFFVLSGFLITGILYRAKSKPAYFKNFYARRTLRIFPLYYLILIGSIVYGVIRLSIWRDGSWARFVGGEFALWTYTTNLAVGFSGRWGAAQPVPRADFAHFWSLAVEEQFYLIWPLVIYLLDRRRAMLCCAAIAIGALALRAVLIAGGATAVSPYVLTPCRMDALALGGLLALYCEAGSPSLKLLVAARWVGALGVALLIGIAAWRGDFSEYDPAIQIAGYALLAVVFTCVVALSLAPREASLLVPVLQNPALRFLGRYSYGAYAYHYIVLMGVLPLIPAPSFAAAGIVQALAFFATTLLIAVLSYHLFESRFLKLKARFT